MTRNRQIAICIAAALASSACSTRPRTFSATVQPAATLAATQGEAAVYANCDQLVRKGHTGNFTSALATGVVGGTAAVGAGVASFASASTMSGAGAAVSIAMPVVGLAAAFGVNRVIRSGRERKYKRVMTTCLSEFGYDVVDWTRMKKKHPGTATLAKPAPIAPEPAPEVALTAP